MWVAVAIRSLQPVVMSPCSVSESRSTETAGWASRSSFSRWLRLDTDAGVQRKARTPRDAPLSFAAYDRLAAIHPRLHDGQTWRRLLRRDSFRSLGSRRRQV